MSAHVVTTILDTPPTPRVVDADVFDAFGWCGGTTLEWRRPSSRDFDLGTPIDGSDPARMVFVFREPCDFLPGELARLHATGMGLEEELALAPYAIDDATDELHARRVPPASLLWLAADNPNALHWGLHDWAHFHNHGPFTARAATELQCDAAALAWVRLNRERAGVTEARLAALEEEVARLAAGRFAEERSPAPDVRAALRAARFAGS